MKPDLTKSIGYWTHTAKIAENNFVYKSLSNWSYNVAVGCEHACRFCYVPSAATNKQAPALKEFGVTNPDEQWGDYVLLRTWDEGAFRRSAQAAEKAKQAGGTIVKGNFQPLAADGNRAVMLCTTTDPYQVIRHPDVTRRKELQTHLREKLVRKALEIIRDETTLNVRILTRSPLAKSDFELMKSFGNRIMFGMSIPTLNDTLARVYEPKAPGPDQRLKTLKEAASYGIPTYVAIAPTYPEEGEKELYYTMARIWDEVRPMTMFHEPINIRAENIARIKLNALQEGIELNTEVFSSRESWAAYAMQQLTTVEKIARSLDINCLHLWPDKSLSHWADKNWLDKWWNRISEWGR